MKFYWLDQATCQDPRHVGGKAAQLSRLAARYPVPPGFCLAASSPRSVPPTKSWQVHLIQAYERLGERCGQQQPSVAVRSSAVGEDGQATSFAGQHETFLNISSPQPVIEAVQRCIASVDNKRSRAYRRFKGLAEQDVRIAVLVQQFIQADASAIVFSADPRTGECDRVAINAAWGIGESLVSGTVTPDLYLIHKADLAILTSQVADKTCMTVAYPGCVREAPVPRSLRQEPALSPEQIIALARLAISLEEQQGWPVDLECAFKDQKLFLLQCRPITTLP